MNAASLNRRQGSHAMPFDMSLGEAGGIFAGAVAGAIGIAKLVGAVISWFANRLDRRQARLDRWEELLNQRDKDYRDKLELRIGILEGRVTRLLRGWRADRAVLIELLGEVRVASPESATISRAEQHLREAFPIDWNTPEELAALANKLDEEGKSQ